MPLGSNATVRESGLADSLRCGRKMSYGSLKPEAPVFVSEHPLPGTKQAITCIAEAW
jgi:hypothetical protein